MATACDNGTLVFSAHQDSLSVHKYTAIFIDLYLCSKFDEDNYFHLPFCFLSVFLKINAGLYAL